MASSMLTGVALGLVTSVTATGLTPAAAPEGVDCGFRITAVHVLAELSGDDSPRAERIRQTLIEQGVNKPGFVPEACYETPNNGGGDQGGGQSGQGGDQGSQGGDQGGQGGGQDTGGGAGGDQSSGAAPGGGSPPAGGGAGDQDAGQGGSGAGQGGAPTGGGATAAEAFGWGEPDVVDDFDNGLQNWNAYDGPGHAGKGRRSPEAASVQDGMLTIKGSPDGTTAGLAWTGNSQRYGRWEGRVKAPKGSKAYNALLLLWPTEENFPVGGEVDFMEIMSPDRDEVNMFLHYGQDNSQVQGKVNVDATQWHNWAVEWTPEGITTFLDGKQWWKTTDTSILPPGPMHLCIQLDWFPDGKQDGQPGEMHVDWVKQWSLDQGQGPSTDSAGSEGSTDADSSTSLTEKQNNQG